MDDTRMDLSQLEDSSTGRSVPSTPLQVSPQGMLNRRAMGVWNHEREFRGIAVDILKSSLFFYSMD